MSSAVNLEIWKVRGGGSQKGADDEEMNVGGYERRNIELAILFWISFIWGVFKEHKEQKIVIVNSLLFFK